MFKYKIKKIPLLAMIFSVVVINVTVIILAKSFASPLILVWLSGSIPSLAVFFVVRLILKLVQLLSRFKNKLNISYGKKISLKHRCVCIIRKSLGALMGGLFTSSVGVTLYWLLLMPLEMIGIVSPIVDSLNKLLGQPYYYTEVYYMLIGIGISFLTAIPGMMLGQNLILDRSIARQDPK